MTDIIIECDGCGKAFCGPGVWIVMRKVGRRILCDDCIEKEGGPAPDCKTDSQNFLGSHAAVASEADRSTRPSTRRRRS